MIESLGVTPTVPRRQCDLHEKKSRDTGPIDKERTRYRLELVAYSSRPFVRVT